jgi:2-C-methyl-D-erythritol 4-phosphate cytidylyltransferase
MESIHPHHFDGAVPEPFDRRVRLYALVPCAGVGERSGASIPKQYVSLAGRSVVGHTLAALQSVSRLDAILVVLSPHDALFEAAAPDFGGERAWVARCGGLTRAQTVASGLQELLVRGAQRDDWVLVHDAARCLVRAQWIDSLIDACQSDPVGGLLALPLADTLKASQSGRVTSTLDRREKWMAQTPQMFRIGLLVDALEKALSESSCAVTDEASAIEALGHRPMLVEGRMENFKVTWPADFDLADRLLASQPCSFARSVSSRAVSEAWDASEVESLESKG